MRQLSGLDTGFLSAETRTTFLHISSLIVLDTERSDGSRVTVPELRAVLEERMHEIPLSRRRLVEVPFQLDNPYWIDDADFDSSFHIRHLAVPSPGDERELAELVAHLASTPLDRNRPLWETYFIEGLEGGDLAILTKVHHASVDGVGGIELLATLLDLVPEPRDAAPDDWEGEAEPSPTVLLTRAFQRMLERPRRLVRFQRNVFESFAQTNPRAVPFFPLLPLLGNLGTAGIALFSNLLQPPPSTLPEARSLHGPDAKIPRTVFNGMISSGRRFAYGSVSLDDVKRIGKSHAGATVNDVVLAIVAETLRPWLQSRGELPDEPLVAMVPISIRSEGADGEMGNQVSMVVSPIHTHIEDPGERVRAIHETMRVVKQEQATVPDDLLQDFAEFATPALAALAARGAAAMHLVDRIEPLANLTISNVPGPQFPLYAGGARVKGLWPCSALADGMGLNVTVVSYDGDVCFGILGCRKQLPDAWELVDEIPRAVDRLLAAGG
ncbi:MAG TPA: wax ester/triacylglycerol synthase family O-acyltransferase [Acidimicrobiales bacterium]|nr:wax ester/triacylglycerol synthase family O-acyltransferase [Acidimicrobiales bacterium]